MADCVRVSRITHAQSLGCLGGIPPGPLPLSKSVLRTRFFYFLKFPDVDHLCNVACKEKINKLGVTVSDLDFKEMDFRSVHCGCRIVRLRTAGHGISIVCVCIAFSI